MTTSENVVSFQVDESVLVLDSSDGCTTRNKTKNYWIVHFKWVGFIMSELYLDKAMFWGDSLVLVKIYSLKIALLRYNSHIVKIFYIYFGYLC